MKKWLTSFFVVALGALALPARADVVFDPNFIISDQEMNYANGWTRNDIQDFLTAKGSFLANLVTPDASGTPKRAADIIYDASQNYSINPKILLVTLQKEQSLVTDDSPTMRQLDWATGYAVCDACSLSDPKVVKFKGFGKQVDGAAGILRWYYENEGNGIVKKKDSTIIIDSQPVTPGSWATAFLYTYTPHLHGNKNFWRIWNAWFESSYPNGTLLKSLETGTYWLVDEGTVRPFKTKTALVSRFDPADAVPVHEIDLKKYTTGAPLSFANYSILRSASTTYLLDNTALRPFESGEVVRAIGYNPDEIIDVASDDLAGYAIGTTITSSTIEPAGVIYQITDLNNRYYLLKNSTLYPIVDRSVVDTNYQLLKVEKHTRKELARYEMADVPVTYRNGTLLRSKDGSAIYVMENDLRRRIADDDTFVALGYKYSNIVVVPDAVLSAIRQGEPLFSDVSLVSSNHKFLGDTAGAVDDLFSPSVASYVVAEYPSGRILAGKNIDDRRSIASLTKLLTAYEYISRGPKDVSLFAFATTTAGDITPFKKGDVVRNIDLLKTVLVASSNANAEQLPLAVQSDQHNFLGNIRKQLEEWGADATSIVDLSGLDDANKSSARDLVAIGVRVFANARLQAVAKSPSESFAVIKGPDKGKKIAFKNTNQLLVTPQSNYTILASKTGYLADSGHNAMMLIQAKKTKKRYLVVSLGASNYTRRFEIEGKLLDDVATKDFSTP